MRKHPVSRIENGLIIIIHSISIIGEDKALSIKVGADAGIPDNEDVILVRGITSDVNRAVKEILQIVEDAKNDEIVSSYVCGHLGNSFPFC